jgi:hypothetical protein
MVIAAANTGKDKRRRKAVTHRAQINRGKWCICIPGNFIFNTVTIKLMAPRSEETPARCKLKIAKSTAPPEWASIPDKGGYTVQPVPAPTSTTEDSNRSKKEGGNSQKLRLFNRGNAISGAPINKGINQLPKPPTKAGITMKKIITNAWAVTITL